MENIRLVTSDQETHCKVDGFCAMKLTSESVKKPAASIKKAYGAEGFS
ncbi:PhnA domain-containing protein [Methylophilus methylotrophus]